MATATQQYQDSARANSGSCETLLVPPQLPPFLATVFDLKPITGPPSNDEVKLVHASMRALSSFLHSSELRDSLVDLSMELSQYLFDIQMACHREKYAVGIFPNDIVYTPPSLPPHIPISLEPVVGPPSDNELRSAHAALRVSDSLLSVPSLLHLDLNMQLSQHLFDLQLARHIQHSTQVRLPGDRPGLQYSNSAPTGTQGPNVAGKFDETHGTDTEVQRGENLSQSGSTAASQLNSIQHPGATQQIEQPVAHARQEVDEERMSGKVLVEIREALKDINKVLVASQNSLARGFNSSYYSNGGYSLGSHTLVNDKGETPEIYDLPTVKGVQPHTTSSFAQGLSVKLLALYLHFYGIGSDLIEGDKEPRIRAGMEEEARQLLAKRVAVQG